MKKLQPIYFTFYYIIFVTVEKQIHSFWDFSMLLYLIILSIRKPATPGLPELECGGVPQDIQLENDPGCSKEEPQARQHLCAQINNGLNSASFLSSAELVSQNWSHRFTVKLENFLKLQIVSQKLLRAIFFKVCQ